MSMVKNENGERAAEITCVSINRSSKIISRCIVAVQIRQRETGTVLRTYLLLDNCSQRTFISDQLAKTLPSLETKIHYHQNNKWRRYKQLKIKDLQVENITYHTSECLHLPNAFSRPKSPASNRDIIKSAQLKQCTCLEHVKS